MRILIVNHNHIGDTLMTTPAIKHLKHSFPSDDIDVLVGGSGKLVMENLKQHTNLIRDIYTRETPKLTKILKGNHYDIGIAFKATFGSALLLWRLRIPKRVGISAEGGGLFLQKKVNLSVREHTIKKNCQVVELLTGEKCTDYSMTFPFDKSEKVKKLVEGKKIAVLNPASTRPAKLWLNDRWVKVGKELLKNGFSVFITGGKDAVETADEMCSKINSPNCVNLANALSINELAHLLSTADIMITTDTGPMHIASAVGTKKIVAIFTSTDHIRYGPLSEGSKVIYPNVKCYPCNKHICPQKTMACSQSILVEDVLKAVFE